MASEFPTSIDTLPDKTDGVDYPQAAEINLLNDAVEKLEAKVGADSSAVATSHDYKITSTVGGHDHDGSNSKSIRSASTAQTGVVELATTAETQTGTDTGRAVTPDGLHDMTTLSGAAWMKDEDNMASNSATVVASQQSIKAYADLKLAKASNLSDVATAATAFTNIKQAATTSATGVVELATNAEALTGTDTERAMTPDDVNYLGIQTGWIPYTAVTPTRASADDPTYVLTFASVNLTSKMSVGMKVKFTQDSATVYGIITAISFSTNTTMTLYCGTDYDVGDTGTYAISAFYYSTQKAPFGFPLDTTKWTQETESTTLRETATPAQNVWYNAESLVIPIGVWRVFYRCTMQLNASTAGGESQNVTLSIANNSESNADFTCHQYTDVSGFSIVPTFAEGVVVEATKVTYYLNYNTNEASVAGIAIAGTRGKTIIRAVCAYL